MRRKAVPFKVLVNLRRLRQPRAVSQTEASKSAGLSLANTIAQGLAQDKTISVCGEMAGDPSLTRLLLGMGLRSFSMHPTQILAVKQVVLRSDTSRLKPWAQRVLESDNPAELLASG